MIIANPIYDVVFKRLMENDRVAKFFISTMIGQKVESLQVKPQEITYSDELAGLRLFRLDFIAVVETEEGEYKKILIEIQKAFNDLDLMRFRNYLAEQYKKEDIIAGEDEILPITTIYILGFKLPEIETACVHVKRNYIDMVNNTVIDKKNAFIERLTHDSYVVQVERIVGRFQTRLDKLLSVFEQSNFVDDKKIIKDYLFEPDEEDEDVKAMTAILHHTGADPETRRQIELEKEAWRTFNALFASKQKKLREQLIEKEKVVGELKQLNEKLETAKENAEEERKREQEARKNAEEERKNAEEERKNAEEERKNAEERRKNAEEARVKAENELEAQKLLIEQLKNKLKDK